MPRASLEFAAALYQEQDKAVRALYQEDDDVLDDIYDAQKRYDDYVRELSIKPEIVTVVPDFADEGYNAYFQAAAWHVVYLSKNTEVLDKMFTLEYQLTDVTWSDHHSFHLLEDKEADFIIEHLKTKGEEERKWLFSVKNYITLNRLDKHLDLFIRNDQFRFPGSFSSVVNYFKVPKHIQLIKEMAKQYGSSIYTRNLMLLQQPEAWESVKTPEGMADDFGDYLARYNAPADLELFTQHIESVPVELKLRYLDRVVAFGNLNALKWLFNQLAHPHAAYRATVFYTMCQFFPDEIDDDPDFEGILEVQERIEELKYQTDDWDLPEFEITTLQSLWVEIQGKLLQIRDFSKRYDGAGEPDQIFDLLHIVRTYRYQGVRDWLNSLIDDLVIYTGQYFPFDCYAYMEKQEAQMDVWEQYLEKNRDKFLPGRWVRWGEYIDE